MCKNYYTYPSPVIIEVHYKAVESPPPGIIQIKEAILETNELSELIQL